jgi:hypothetical protein
MGANRERHAGTRGYQRWLIAKTSSFLPSTAAVAKLVERLRKEQWIPDPKAPTFRALRFEGQPGSLAAKTGGYAVHTIDNSFGDDVAAASAASTEAQPSTLTAAWLDDPEREEIRLVWPVQSDDPSPVKHPLSRRVAGAVRYALELHRCHEYVYPLADTIEVVPTMCACGDDLAFHWDEEEVVPAFEASAGIFHECEACSRTFDPSMGAARLTNPFDGAVEEVRGGAAHRFALKVDCGDRFVADAMVAFAPELVALVEDEFGRDMREVGALR